MNEELDQIEKNNTWEMVQRPEGIFISQGKYLREMLKRFQMEDSKPVGTPM